MAGHHTARLLTYQGIPVWRHIVVIQWALQVLSAVAVAGLVFWFFTNISNAIDDRDIPYGFSFLERAYQTPIGEHVLPYDSSDTYAYAFLVAASNTVVLAIVGVILAISFGTLIGIARISSNWALSRLALAYVEFFRNVPVLVLILFTFYIMLLLPPVAESYSVGGRVYLHNGGLAVPWPTPAGQALPALAWLALAAAGAAAGVLTHRFLTRREAVTGHVSYPLTAGIATALGIALIFWIVIALLSGAAPLTIETPAPTGRFSTIEGGLHVRAGAIVMLISLVIYTAAFIAEIVRAGIQSVGKGQTEAALATGLHSVGVLRYIVFPQAVRVIVPPLISQCLNLTKNSSLAAAIGFADLTNVAITMTQTAPAISIFLIIMAAYLLMSLAWSAIGNIYNWRARIVGT